MKTFAFVFARGGSKEVPRKNIRSLGGKPLLAHSIYIAQQLESVSKVFVSTDDQEIAEIGKSYGAQIIDRPKELAQDHSPEWLSWQHAIQWLKKNGEDFEIFLSLPTTAPLRSVEDVEKCLNKLEEGFDFVITYTETNHSPWFNMVEKTKSGALQLALCDKKKITRRQDVPVLYNISTVAYVTRANFIIENKRIWDGKAGGIKIPRERALDIDTELDFEIAEFLMQKKFSNYNDDNSIRYIEQVD